MTCAALHRELLRFVSELKISRPMSESPKTSADGSPPPRPTTPTDRLWRTHAVKSSPQPSQLVSAREAYPSRSYASFGLLPQVRRQPTTPGERPGVPEGLCIGNPERLVRALKGWESTGADGVNFLLNAAETVPQEEVLSSLRLFAKEVMPHFKESD